ncbi:putative ORfan [Saudi moumouvirus]|nr:putative ORfan [Saudi moumouvirus]
MQNINYYDLYFVKDDECVPPYDNYNECYDYENIPLYKFNGPRYPDIYQILIKMNSIVASQNMHFPWHKNYEKYNNHCLKILKVNAEHNVSDFPGEEINYQNILGDIISLANKNLFIKFFYKIVQILKLYCYDKNILFGDLVKKINSVNKKNKKNLKYNDEQNFLSKLDNELKENPNYIILENLPIKKYLELDPKIIFLKKFMILTHLNISRKYEDYECIIFKVTMDYLFPFVNITKNNIDQIEYKIYIIKKSIISEILKDIIKVGNEYYDDYKSDYKYFIAKIKKYIIEYKHQDIQMDDNIRCYLMDHSIGGLNHIELFNNEQQLNYYKYKFFCKSIKLHFDFDFGFQDSSENDTDDELKE